MTSVWLSVMYIFSTSQLLTGASLPLQNYACLPEVQRLQEYIQINTAIGENLTPAVNFWKKLAQAAGVPVSVSEFIPGYPVIVIKWPGRDDTHSSIMLNTHMDVVPADILDGWSYPPFSGHIDERGFIYGRGMQKIKSVSMQHFEALIHLRSQNITLLRNVYMVLTPDGEVATKNGLIPFLNSKEFKDLNVGMSINGGVPSSVQNILVLHRGKSRWLFSTDCNGPSGASGQLVDYSSTADGLCGSVYFLYSMYRKTQVELSQQTCPPDPATFTSINFVGTNAAVTNNVIPSRLSLIYDSYLGVNTNFNAFETMVREWVAAAGSNVTLRTIIRENAGPQTKVDSSNPYWNALQEASKILSISLIASTAPGPEDASYIAASGYPVFGISPMPNTENLIHAVNERLDTVTYLNGITMVEVIIQYVANVPAHLVSHDPSSYLDPPNWPWVYTTFLN